jgi:ABC-type Fe3+/spermidine/putrescine transport system ATPase subunit
MPAVVAGGEEVRLEHGPAVRVPADGLAPGDRCHAVVRPEKLRIESLEAATPSANGMPRVEGTVESSLYLGTATQIVVDLGGGVRMTVLVPNASEAERQRLPGGGARVALSWDPEHMHVVRDSPAIQRGEPDEEP